MTKEEAKELSIKKWELIVSDPNINIYRIRQKYPELVGIKSGCGYCQLYRPYSKDCTSCPIDFIKPDGINCGCNRKGHPFKAFINNKTKRNAQTVLNLIKQS